MSVSVDNPQGANLIGRNELGSITVHPSVVSRVASRACINIPEVGAAHTRMLGIAIPGAGLMGGRETGQPALPKANAEVHGASSRLELEVAVLWPHSVKDVTERLRASVIDEVQRICGVKVSEVHIWVPEFATAVARNQNRVR